MAKNRYIDTKFWVDTYIGNLDPSEKLVFIYLLTNHLTNICGIYEVSLKQIAFDTGYDKDMVDKILKRFERDGKMKYSNGWVAIKNWMKHQATDGNVKKGIESGLTIAPQELVKWVQDPSRPFETLEQLKPKPELKLKPKHELELKHNICSEPNSASDPVILDMPLIKKDGVYPITQSLIDEFKEFYPAADVEQELRKMVQWCRSNPSKLKTKTGIRAFMTRWLGKCQDNATGIRPESKAERSNRLFNETMAKMGAV